MGLHAASRRQQQPPIRSCYFPAALIPQCPEGMLEHSSVSFGGPRSGPSGGTAVGAAGARKAEQVAEAARGETEAKAKAKLDARGRGGEAWAWG